MNVLFNDLKKSVNFSSVKKYNSSNVSYTFTEIAPEAGVVWILTCGAWGVQNISGAIGTVRYSSSDETCACVLVNYNDLVSAVSIDNETGVFTITLNAVTSYIALKILNI